MDVLVEAVSDRVRSAAAIGMPSGVMRMELPSASRVTMRPFAAASKASALLLDDVLVVETAPLESLMTVVVGDAAATSGLVVCV